MTHSLNKKTPTGLNQVQLSLWYAKEGFWDEAHDALQGDDTPAASHVHAHLHREEGDLANARYWYRNAGEPAVKDQSIEDEREALIVRYCSDVSFE